MNTPNPLVPQGSLGEQAARGKSSLFITFFVIAIAHVLVLGGVLISGCTRQDPEEKTDLTSTETNESPLAPLGTDPNALPEAVTTNTATVTDTNTFVAGLPANDTNAVAAPAVDPLPLPGNTAQAPVDPSATTGAATPPAGGGSEYEIQKGDSFYTVSKKTGVPLSAIVRANPGVDSTRLKIGQRIVVPAYTPSAAAPDASAASSTGGATYSVKSGDTLSRIAAKHGTTVRAIREANNLRTDRIKINQKLRIPGAAAPASATSNPGGLPLTPGQ